jgi:hypothetical protein
VAGANKPDGKSNTQRVSFTRRDADRIGRVVRTVEAGDKKGNALTFGHRQQPGQGGVGVVLRRTALQARGALTALHTVDRCDEQHIRRRKTATAVNLFADLASGVTWPFNRYRP